MSDGGPRNELDAVLAARHDSDKQGQGTGQYNDTARLTFVINTEALAVFFETQAAAWAFLREQGGLAAGYGHPVPQAGGYWCPPPPAPVNEALAQEAEAAAPGGEVWARAAEATKYVGVKGPWWKRKGSG